MDRAQYIKCLLATLFVLAILSTSAWATPEYSARTGEGCRSCHIHAQGGALNPTGLEYAASGYRWPPSGGFRVLGPIKKPVRFVIGFFHITASFLWFGTILYVHILLRPAYASKGLPRGEVMMGSVSMLVVGITGIFLTLSRIRGLDVLRDSPWGRLLSLKILFYLIMLGSAILAVTLIGPRLKRQSKLPTRKPEDGVYDPQTLSAFDGTGGKPAFAAHDGKVYDMSGLKLWKNGVHMKHPAGTDLTEAMKRAPHGIEKLEDLPVVGTFDASRRPPLTFEQKAFYFVAYMNLGLVFAVLLTIAAWRWAI
jgi:predicted heme/steroid binding protein